MRSQKYLAFDAGWRARHAGWSIKTNPYPRMKTTIWYWWRSGWKTADHNINALKIYSKE